MNIDFKSIAPFMYPVLVMNFKRNALKEYLKNKDIETGISYIPCHKFSISLDENKMYPIADKIYEEILCLPLHCDLNDNDIDIVVKEIRNFFEEERNHNEC